MIYFASDHAGFHLKEQLMGALEGERINCKNVGCFSAKACDYPDFGRILALELQKNQRLRGIAICGTGIGMSIALNRYPWIRAARCCSEEDAETSRKHNDANVLVLGARQLSFEQALTIVKRFLDTGFERGRHLARVAKMAQLA